MPAKTDQQLLETIQYAVMEAPDLGATWPSGLWTRDEVLHYLNERQSRFLKATLLQLGVAVSATLLPGDTHVPLPSDWIATVSVVWNGDDGVVRELIRADTFELDHGDPGWTSTRGRPAVYLDLQAPTLQIQIGPPPDVGGTLEVLYVPQGAPLTGAGDTYLTVPDLFADAVGKYGPLADMFGKDGRGANAEKAGYCQQRFDLALACAAVILQGRG